MGIDRMQSHGVVRVPATPQQGKLRWTQAFTLAHRFLVQERYSDAGRLASELLKRRPTARQAILLEARCASAVKDYEACHWLIQRAFDEKDKFVVQPLHSAFTFRSVGLLDDAKGEIRGILKEYQEFPSGWLFYGDVMELLGNSALARLCWQRAMIEDKSIGGVRMAARERVLCSRGSNRHTSMSLDPPPDSTRPQTPSDP